MKTPQTTSWLQIKTIMIMSDSIPALATSLVNHPLMCDCRGLLTKDRDSEVESGAARYGRIVILQLF